MLVVILLSFVNTITEPQALVDHHNNNTVHHRYRYTGEVQVPFRKDQSLVCEVDV